MNKVPGNKMNQLKEDYQAVMKTSAGKRLIGHLLDQSQLHRSILTDDPCVAFYNEGRRSMGIIIMNDLNTHVPGGFIEVLKTWEENNGRSK